MTHLAPRFWIPPEGALHLADDGFLPDPEDAYTAAFNPAVVPFSAIAALRCLVLIGEPGLGKTTALVAERLALDDQLRKDAADAGVLAVDLGATREEAVLRGQLFESDRYRAWQSGTGQLHLFLDSLDEARLRVETIADLLLEGLEGAEFDRLHLRLACRSADRHRRLEDALRAGFGDDRFAVYELVPLRRRDVSDAAREQGLDANTFLGEVIGRSLQPLAIRPLTLRFLLRAAGEPRGLPAGATELYRRGCQLLVQEPDEDRRRGAVAGRLAAAQRFAVATRIAAATILAGRSAVVCDIDLRASSDETDVEHLAGGRELTEGTAVADSFVVDVDAVHETLSTGLFSARGAGRLGWAHQSLGEFLAAVYIASRGMREQQVLDLLTLKEGEVRRVIPQLREVAGWLATLSPFLFEVLLAGDPDVLLRSDLAVADAGQREALVGALLAGVGADTIERWDGRIRSNFPRLDHPGMADQLRDVLTDAGAPMRGRELAADLGGACRVAALEPTLVELALSDDAPLSLRQAAVSALRGWAGIETRRELVPLATEPLASDVDDELRGAALSAVWPDILGASANWCLDCLTQTCRWRCDGRRRCLVGTIRQMRCPRLCNRSSSGLGRRGRFRTSCTASMRLRRRSSKAALTCLTSRNARRDACSLRQRTDVNSSARCFRA